MERELITLPTRVIDLPNFKNQLHNASVSFKAQWANHFYQQYVNKLEELSIDLESKWYDMVAFDESNRQITVADVIRHHHYKITCVDWLTRYDILSVYLNELNSQVLNKVTLDNLNTIIKWVVIHQGGSWDGFHETVQKLRQCVFEEQQTVSFLLRNEFNFVNIPVMSFIDPLFYTLVFIH